MKYLRIMCVLLVFVSILIPVNCYADTLVETNITYYEDGSYLVETIESTCTRASGTKTGAKNQTYYGSSGSAEWKVTLSGTFTYTGSTSSCTASSVSVTIYNSDWYTISKSASKSGNTASAFVTMGYKVLGITTNKVNATPTLVCDANGNLS